MLFEANSMLERIGKEAFADSGLEGFTAPAALREVGEKAFKGCVRLKTVGLNEGLQ